MASRQADLSTPSILKSCPPPVPGWDFNNYLHINAAQDLFLKNKIRQKLRISVLHQCFRKIVTYPKPRKNTIPRSFVWKHWFDLRLENIPASPEIVPTPRPVGILYDQMGSVLHFSGKCLKTKTNENNKHQLMLASESNLPAGINIEVAPAGDKVLDATSLGGIQPPKTEKSERTTCCFYGVLFMIYLNYFSARSTRKNDYSNWTWLQNLLKTIKLKMPHDSRYGFVRFTSETCHNTSALNWNSRTSEFGGVRLDTKSQKPFYNFLEFKMVYP